jgi:hypothetical protein
MQDPPGRGEVIAFGVPLDGALQSSHAFLSSAIEQHEGDYR